MGNNQEINNKKQKTNQTMESVKKALEAESIAYQDGRNGRNVFIDIPSLNATVGIWGGDLVSCPMKGPIEGNIWDFTSYEDTYANPAEIGRYIVRKLKQKAGKD